MKIKTWIHPDPLEVEVEVSADDIASALEENPDSLLAALRLINRVSVLMKSIGIGLISEMSWKQRELIGGFLKEQAARFDAPAVMDGKLARFGELMWGYIVRQGGDFCGEEISEEILPLAMAAGLCERVAYDPAVHGEGIEADVGSEIWFWGEGVRGGDLNDQTQQPHRA